MQFGGACCSLVSVGAGWCSLVQVVAVWCLVQFDECAGLFKLVQVGVICGMLMQFDTVRYGVV